MADWNKPSGVSESGAYVEESKSRDVDAATMFEEAGMYSNLPNKAVRITNDFKLQRYNSVDNTWSDIEINAVNLARAVGMMQSQLISDYIEAVPNKLDLFGFGDVSENGSPNRRNTFQEVFRSIGGLEAGKRFVVNVAADNTITFVEFPTFDINSLGEAGFDVADFLGFYDVSGTTMRKAKLDAMLKALTPNVANSKQYIMNIAQNGALTFVEQSPQITVANGLADGNYLIRKVGAALDLVASPFLVVDYMDADLHDGNVGGTGFNIRDNNGDDIVWSPSSNGYYIVGVLIIASSNSLWLTFTGTNLVASNNFLGSSGSNRRVVDGVNYNMNGFMAYLQTTSVIKFTVSGTLNNIFGRVSRLRIYVNKITP